MQIGLNTEELGKTFMANFLRHLEEMKTHREAGMIESPTVNMGLQTIIENFDMSDLQAAVFATTLAAVFDTIQANNAAIARSFPPGG